MTAASEQKKKVVVIGIDGLPHSLLTEYIRQGVMPKFRRIVENGSLYSMKSSLPEVSSVAWTSFMTGKNPGEHGIFGFMELDENYNYRFPNFSSVQTQTIWEKLALPAVVINMPGTYPAVRSLQGILISGFVALDLDQAVYPRRALAVLKDMGYRLDVKSGLAKESPEAFFQDLFEVVDKRMETIRHFFDEEEWQLFIAVITATDRLHHYFYPDALEEGPYHSQFLRLYRQLDDFLDLIFQKACAQHAVFMTCSDHGFTTIRSEVNINRWLMENGYLQVKGNRQGLTGIDASSRAFCLDPGRIYIHRRDRYPKGCVSDDEYPAIRDELVEKISALKFEGDAVVARIYTNEEAFSGPHSRHAPDLYLLAHPGYDIKGAVNRPQVFGSSHFRGCHTYDDAHLFVYPQKSITDPQIGHVADLIERCFS